MAASKNPDQFEIRNEFGTVVVSLDHSANGPRLRLAGQDAGTEIFLDVVEVEALSGMSHRDFRVIVETHVRRSSTEE